MKNFFKKLSFVMALAMVLTALAPAVAGADASYIYKRGNDTQKEAVEVYFGDAETKRDLNVKINGTKTNDGTWKIGNKKIATIDENGVVTPVKNGTTTAKFTAEDGTVAKVKVVVGTRAAGVKVKDNGVEVAELTLVAGESKELKFSAYVSGKAKKAGATTSSQKAEVAAVESEAVKVTVDGKYMTVEAVKAGEATITVTAGKKTATVAVTVVEDLAASQTGVKKITVTGSNLSDKVADYTVKRGSVKVTLESVTLNADKTAAVLVAASTKYPKGTYTVTVGEETTAEFEVVDQKLAKIDVDANLILAGQYGVSTQAAVAYTAYNQFGEDVTKEALAGNLNATCTLGIASTPVDGVITVNNISTYTPVGTAGKVVIFDMNGTGVTAEADVTLSSMAVPSDVKVAGIWNSTLKKMVELKANVDYSAYDNLYVAINVVDQYGRPMSSLNATAEGQVAIIPNAMLTGFALENTATTYSWDWDAFAILMPITEAVYSAGDVTLTFVLKNAVKNVTNTITIAPTAQVASIDVYPTDTIYQGETAVFEYVALDKDGNEVKNVALLNDPTYGVRLPAEFSFADVNYDGVAELYFNGAALSPVREGLTGYYSGLLSTANYSFTKTLQFTYNAAARPAYILGVDATKALGVISGGAIELTTTDMMIADQYGRQMSDTDVTNSGCSVVFATTALSNHKFSVATAAGVTTFSSIAKGTEKFTATLVASGGAVVINGDTSFTLLSTELADLSSFGVVDMGTLYKGSATSVSAKAPAVYGVAANGIKVTIPADGGYYTVISELNNAGTLLAASAAAVGTGLGQVAEKEYAVKVVINNVAGTEVNTTVKVACAAPVVTSAAPYRTYGNYVEVAASALASNVVTAVLDKLVGYDQYGYKMTQTMDTTNTYAATTSVLVADLPLGATVNNNNTANATVTVSAGQSFTVTLTFAGGLTVTTKVIAQ